MAQPTKILYIITQSELGGASGYVFNLALAMKTKGHEVEIAAGGDDELFDQAKSVGITTHKLQHLVREINPLQDIKGYFEIKKLIKKSRPDIVHLNSSKVGVLGALAAKSKAKKIIYTVHGFVFNEPLPGWKKLFYKFSEKLTAKFKTKLICVSEFDRQTGIKNKITSPNKLITIHNGISKINFLDKRSARQELNVPQDKIIIGTIANFYPTKSLDTLIDAAKIVTTKSPEVIFRLIGYGDLENKLKTQIKNLNLEDKFILGKKINGAKYLKAFDIYASSSVKEGFPYTILEAMSAGLPIISTNVGGIPEALNNTNGILIGPNNPEALADGIIKLIKDKNLASQLGAKAQKDVEQNFNLEKMIEATQGVYFE